MNIVLHLGLHKTGSTFLQRNVFPYIRDVNLVFVNPLTHKIKLKKGCVNLISREGLSGKPHFSRSDTRFSLADGLKKLFPIAKVLLVIRDKKTWCRSLYSQYIKSGGYKSYSRWYDMVFNKDFLNFKKYVDYLRSLWDDVLVLDFELLKKSTRDFVKQIAVFIGVDHIDFVDRVVGKRLKGYNLLLLRFLNVLGLNPVRWYYWYETRFKLREGL